ncbi:MAG: chemotaxis protein CheA [Nitrospirae bacterium]|nr:chemotaxis protein CheA [Nitrospirota bacterium]
MFEGRLRAERSDTMKTDRPIKDFLAEAEDILETANQTLLSLETGQAAGRIDPDLVNALFRAIHSFKGLAGMFGLKEPSELSHKLEFLLDELRLGKVGMGRKVLDAVIEIVAQLGRLVQQAGTDHPFEDIASALAIIDGILQAKPSAAAGRPLGEQIGLDQGILQVLTEYEEHRLRECIRERKNLFMLKAQFEFANFETAIKELNATLKKHGEIICTLPTAGGGSGIGFSIVVGTTEDAGVLTSAIALPDVAVEKIAYAEERRTEERRIEEPKADAAAGLKSVSNTVRVNIYKLDSLMNVVGEMHLIKNIIVRITKELRASQGVIGISADLYKAQRSLERKLNELQEGILEVRMVPIGQIFTRLAQVVRKYVKDAGKEIDLQLQGEETELDKIMIEDLADPLMHLIRNAIDHGIEAPEVRRQLGKPEQGSVKLTAFPRGNHVVITIEDDGAGMDPAKILNTAVEKGVLSPDHGLDLERDRKEIFDLIFLPGFTTNKAVTEMSGRGVGMDVVKRNVSKLSGMIDIQTEVGAGSIFTLTLPITLAIIKALVIESGGQVFAIPLSSVLEILQATSDQVETIEGREVMAVREDTIPLLRLARAFNLSAEHEGSSFYVILVGIAERRLGIMVDHLKDQQEIVIKPLGKRFSETPGIAGATELGDRRGVVLVLDVESLVDGALKRVAVNKQ